MTRFDKNPIIQVGDDARHLGFNLIGTHYLNWIELFTSTKRPSKNLVTVAEIGNAFGKVWIHNPFGHDAPPMRWMQRSILLEKAKLNPLDVRLQNAANTTAFLQGALAAEYDKYFYIGYPRGVYPGTDTPTQWVNRLWNEYKFYLDAKPKFMGLDSLMGLGHGKHNPSAEYRSHIPFWDEAEPRLIRRVAAKSKEVGVEVGNEPFKLKSKVDENDYLIKPVMLSTIITDSSYNANIGKWDRLGKYEPGVLGEPVYYLIRLNSTDTFEQKVDHVNREQQAHPNFTMVINYGGIQDTRILEVTE